MMFFDELDDEYIRMDEEFDGNYFNELFRELRTNGLFVLVGKIQRWDGSGYGHYDEIFNTIYDAILKATDGWGCCYLRIYEENYGRLYIDVIHHDGTNHLEVRELTPKGEHIYNYTDMYNDPITKIVNQKGATRNVKYFKRYY